MVNHIKVVKEHKILTIVIFNPIKNRAPQVIIRSINNFTNLKKNKNKNKNIRLIKNFQILEKERTKVQTKTANVKVLGKQTKCTNMQN